jgi:hypothetical protein
VDSRDVTDATPDPLLDETTPADGAGPEYVVTPTLRAFGELHARVEHLEASSPAVDETGEEDDDTLTAERLGRHRAELEQIKRTVNSLIEYLGTSDAQLPVVRRPRRPQE